MDFNHNSEQRVLAESVARFGERDYGFEDRRKLAGSADGFSRDHWATFAELGWFGAGLSEEEGGFGGGAVENAILFEGFGRILLIEPVLAHAVLAIQALAALPAGERRDGLIGQAVMGEVMMTLAHDEAEGWGAVDWVATQAREEGGGYRLTGAKSRVLAGHAADDLLVTARLSGAVDDADGIGLFLVKADAAGLSGRPYRLLDGSRASDVTLDGVAGELLTSGVEARAAVVRAYRHGTVALCADALGAMEAALWQTRDYLKTRKQFGVTLNNFQALQHRMADMLIETELSRSMLLQALSALTLPDAEQDAGISAAKVAIGRSALFVTGQAIQLHGGIGMTDELMVGHFYKRTRVIESLLGDLDHHFDRFFDSVAITPVPDDIAALSANG